MSPADEPQKEERKWSSEEEIDPDGFIYLEERVNTYPSIESISLKFNDKTKAPRHVYGEIKVKLYQVGRCIYIFHRHGNDPQPVPEDSDGFELLLCGPTNCLKPHESVVAVDLYGEGAQPLCSGEFILEDNKRPGNYHKPIHVYLDLKQDRGKLCLCYTKIHSGIPARFDFYLDGDHENDETRSGFTLLGTIKFRHNLLEGSNPNWLAVYDSRHGRVEVPYGEPIPLPRSDFIVHAQLGEEGDDYFFGGSLTIAADLQLVPKDTSDSKIYSIKGETDIVVNQFDKIWRPLYFVLEDKNLKRKEPHGGSTGALRIKITVLPFHEHWPDGDEMKLIH